MCLPGEKQTKQYKRETFSKKKTKSKTLFFLFYKYNNLSAKLSCGWECKLWAARKANLWAYWHTPGTRIVPGQLNKNELMNKRIELKRHTCNINDIIFVSIVAYDQLSIWRENKNNSIKIQCKCYTNPVRSQMTLKCVGATVPWRAIWEIK